MLSWGKIIKVLLLIVSVILVAAVSEVEAKTGSYTINFKAGVTGAPAGTTVRVTATAEDGTEYDETFNFGGGETEEQMRNVIRTDLDNAGWDVVDNVDNGIIITGTQGGSPIKKVDASDDQRNVTVTVDGNCLLASCMAGNRDFNFICSSPNADATYPGTIALTLNAMNITAALAGGDSPIAAATKLETAINASGLVATRSDSVVTLDWDNSTNQSLLGSVLEIDMGLTDGAGGPHLTMEMPDAVVSDVPTMSRWGVIIAVLALLALGTFVIIRKQGALAR